MKSFVAKRALRVLYLCNSVGSVDNIKMLRKTTFNAFNIILIKTDDS